MAVFAYFLFPEHFCNSKCHDLGIFNTYIEWVIHTFSSWSILKDFTRPLRPDNSIKIHDVSPVENTKEIVLLLLLLQYCNFSWLHLKFFRIPNWHFGTRSVFWGYFSEWNSKIFEKSWNIVTLVLGTLTRLIQKCLFFKISKSL